ncbi:hypothetical protein [Promicromonospora sp. NPDC060271]|uniref:hypothetical protein n=1 Tax=Promicromonospora sp. NPDC060271 TaxID=3347089 RepID=UPI0036643A2F
MCSSFTVWRVWLESCLSDVGTRVARMRASGLAWSVWGWVGPEHRAGAWATLG